MILSSLWFSLSFSLSSLWLSFFLYHCVASIPILKISSSSWFDFFQSFFSFVWTTNASLLNFFFLFLRVRLSILSLLTLKSSLRSKNPLNDWKNKKNVVFLKTAKNVKTFRMEPAAAFVKTFWQNKVIILCFCFVAADQPFLLNAWIKTEKLFALTDSGKNWRLWYNLHQIGIYELDTFAS